MPSGRDNSLSARSETGTAGCSVLFWGRVRVSALPPAAFSRAATGDHSAHRRRRLVRSFTHHRPRQCGGTSRLVLPVSRVQGRRDTTTSYSSTGAQGVTSSVHCHNPLTACSHPRCRPCLSSETCSEFPQRGQPFGGDLDERASEAAHGELAPIASARWTLPFGAPVQWGPPLG